MQKKAEKRRRRQSKRARKEARLLSGLDDEKRIPLMSKMDRERLTVASGELNESYRYFRPGDEFDDHYVYFVFSGQRLIYIGMGKGDRYKHALGNSSHNGCLRKAEDKRIYIVRHGLPRSTAEYIESIYIRRWKPIANIDKNPLYPDTKRGRDRLKAVTKHRADKRAKKATMGVAPKTRINKGKNARKKYFEANEKEYAERDLDRQHLLDIGKYL